MNRLLKKIILFLVLLVPAYLIALITIYQTNTAKFFPNVLDKSKNNGFLLSRIRELPKYKEIDILFVGSSHSSREFDPRLFKGYGFTSFNLGSNAQTPINSEFLLNTYLDSLKPKRIIFEVYFRFFETDPIESAIDIISNSQIDIQNLKLVLSKPNLQVYNTIAYLSINRLIEPLEQIEEQSFSTDRYIAGGYIEKVLPDSVNKRLSNIQTNRKINLRADQVDALKRIIDLANRKKIPLTLVSAPVTKEFLSQFENYNEFSKLINEIASQHAIDYIDYNSKASPTFNSYLDFYDHNHLNQKGVIKFNKNFIEEYLMNQ